MNIQLKLKVSVNKMSENKIYLNKEVTNTKIEFDSMIDDVKTQLTGLQEWKNKIDSLISNHKDTLNRHDKSIESTLHMFQKCENILDKE